MRKQNEIGVIKSILYDKVFWKKMSYRLHLDNKYSLTTSTGELSNIDHCGVLDSNNTVKYIGSWYICVVREIWNLNVVSAHNASLFVQQRTHKCSLQNPRAYLWIHCTQYIIKKIHVWTMINSSVDYAHTKSSETQHSIYKMMEHKRESKPCQSKPRSLSSR